MEIWKDRWSYIIGTAISVVEVFDNTPSSILLYFHLHIFKKQFLNKFFPSQVLQRIDDVSLMCDKRIASLKKLTLKPPRPVQTVTPEPAVPLQPPGGAPHLLRRRTHSKVSTALSNDSVLTIYQFHVAPIYNP